MPIELASITIYPVKSCRGVALASSRVLRRGLALDRRWMVVDAVGRFLTQREEPRLALVDTEIQGDAIRLSARDHGEATIPITTEAGALTDVEIWGRRVRALAHEDAGRFVSALLGRQARVVHLPERYASPSASRHARPGDEVSFADGYPLLVASEGSLDDLGARIEARGDARVPMVRFRPNVVVRGAPAWDEDGWAAIAIGGVRLRAPKPCERCVMTTIDPASAKAGPEPLRTLASFRKREGGVWFGVNLQPDDEGDVAVGDPVRVLERKPAPVFEGAKATG